MELLQLKQEKHFLEKVDISIPRPRAALLMRLKKYSAIGNSAIGNYLVLCSKLVLKNSAIRG